MNTPTGMMIDITVIEKPAAQMHARYSASNAPASGWLPAPGSGAAVT